VRKAAKWPSASICVPCCAGSAPSFSVSLLKRCAVPGMPALAFGFTVYGPVKGDSGIVFERSCDSS
jgi:hypothetical protein